MRSETASTTPCTLERVDRDGVADPEPPLEEHQQPGDHVHQEPLGCEGDDDREERAPTTVWSRWAPAIVASESTNASAKAR